MESKTYLYPQLGDLAGKKINFNQHELDCVAGVWRKNRKEILVLDFSKVPGEAVVAAANKSILTVLTSADKSLNIQKIFSERLAKGLSIRWHTKNSTILWKLLGSFLLRPEEFRAAAKVSKQRCLLSPCQCCIRISC